MIAVLAVLDVMLMVMLAAVAGLVLWLHFKIQDFQKDAKRLPQLSDTLVENMVKARAALAQIMSTLETTGPEMEAATRKAQDAFQDVQYTVARAEEVLNRLETKVDQAKNIEESMEETRLALPLGKGISARVEMKETLPKVQKIPQPAKGAKSASPAQPKKISHIELAEAQARRRKSAGEKALEQSVKGR